MALARTALICAAAGLALSACGQREDKAAATGEAPAAQAPAAAAQAGQPPARKAGLWRQTISMGDFTQSTRICLDAATEEQVSLWGGQESAEMCSQNEASRAADGSWRFSSVCDMGTGGRTTTTGVARGDFSTRYTVEADSVTEGAAAPQMNGARKMTVEAVWEGPCPEGFRPGDIELPGNVRMNLLDAQKMGR
ncbi:MAG: DUF3617 domain-containing protein [Phenylobacterium sp.]|uniref:DUF3617 domain-containing protein n=1 Tax=Phenylobacterium sp. TaxID=1871053 RepID=UPI00391C3BED